MRVYTVYIFFNINTQLHTVSSAHTNHRTTLDRGFSNVSSIFPAYKHNIRIMLNRTVAI